MLFKIIDVETYASPRNLNVDNILEHYLTNCEEIKNALKECTFRHTNTEKGFQIELHEQLEDTFRILFLIAGSELYMGGYSPTMREKPDVAIGRKGHPKKIFIEIEFRPNEHKDIVKFLIGHKKQTLELGILIVAIDREVIKKGYTTMPQYKKCIQTIEELQSDCPILVMGIDGRWVPA